MQSLKESGWVLQVQIIKKIAENIRKNPEELSLLFWSAAFQSDIFLQEQVQRKTTWETQRIQKAVTEREP